MSDRICRFYNTPGGCRNGNHCQFIHEDHYEQRGPPPRRVEYGYPPPPPPRRSGYYPSNGRPYRSPPPGPPRRYDRRGPPPQRYPPPPSLRRNYERNDDSVPPAKSERSRPRKEPPPPEGYVQLGPYHVQISDIKKLTSKHKPDVRLTQKNRKVNSKRRLMRDYRDLVKNPLHTVCAAPLRNDIYKWHGNVVGMEGSEWFGVVLHLTMEFSEDYPARPPRVTLKTPISHSHVGSEGHICLDLLQTHASPYRWFGWSTAYSVSSILLQLQNFLFEDEDRRHRLQNATIEYETNRAMNYVCHTCGHNMKKLEPNPWHRHMYKISQKEDKKEEKQQIKRKKQITEDENEEDDPKFSQNPKRKKRDGLFGIIPLEVLRWNILVYLDLIQLRKWLRVSKRLRKIVKKMISIEKESLICFHTKRPYLDMEEVIHMSNVNPDKELPERVILGFGIEIRRNPYSGLIDYVMCQCLDYLSYRAYNEMGVRKSVFKQEFKEFLPIYINEYHSRRSFPLFCKLVAEYTNLKYFHPLEGVEILLKVMNTCIIRIMNGKEHCSEVCLTGYFHSFRMLIAICERYPWVGSAIDDRVRRFIELEGHRSSIGERNIGNFLQCVAVSSKYSLKDVLPALLDEQWDRNVKWSIKKYSELLLGNLSSERRLLMSWCGSIVPCQLVLTNQAFHKLVKPEGVSLTIQEIGEKLDKKYGQPPGYVQRAFQKEIFEIMKINNFNDFFNKLGMKTVKSIELTLLDSLSNSHFRGYHKPKTLPMILRTMDEMRRKQVQNRGNNNNSTTTTTWSPWQDRNDSPANLEVLERVRRLPSLNSSRARKIDYYCYGTKFGEKRFEFLQKEEDDDDEDEEEEEEEEVEGE